MNHEKQFNNERANEREYFGFHIKQGRKFGLELQSKQINAL
jgi:hypothetical protein